MMKKTLAVFLAVMMLLSVTLCAAGEEASSEVKFLSWQSAWRAIVGNQISGTFYNLKNQGLKLWIPESLQMAAEPPENCDLYFASEDNAVSVAVKLQQGGEGTDLNTLMGLLEEQNTEDKGIFWVNELYALLYESKEMDTMAAAVDLGGGTILTFAFYPESDPNFSALNKLITASIQPIDTTLKGLALMMDADLGSVWGGGKKVTYTDDTNSVFVNIWDEGITTENFGAITNWQTIRDFVESTAAGYFSSLEALGMKGTHVTVQYISNTEGISFLTVEDGTVTYEAAAK